MEIMNTIVDSGVATQVLRIVFLVVALGWLVFAFMAVLEKEAFFTSLFIGLAIVFLLLGISEVPQRNQYEVKVT
ncbi:hypothetical protein NQ117_05425 [Paenibacillus sp. SC116]|uniref:hypothetical protein n=1 Tax=Paenibacillus sp. SC116 TaxID=2968986 RepID=UPI00215A3F23|nr:hypothetical protein [Paenibacillus sp. SC116]MCR8843113.1 hypothetical protein [Paenibacillus sp. SC116]